MNSDISREIVAFDLIGGENRSVGWLEFAARLQLVSREFYSMGYCNWIGLIFAKPRGGIGSLNLVWTVQHFGTGNNGCFLARLNSLYRK